MRDEFDYISNPKSENWNKNGYFFSVHYRWENVKNGSNGIRHIKVKSVAFAHELIKHWNMQGAPSKNWLYRIVQWDDLTMAEHAELWQVESGKLVPNRGTKAWDKMYQNWIQYAFDKQADEINGE